MGRTYHDPLHGAIALSNEDPVESLLIQLIDTPEFQRLRRIRQLGPASLTFHGAEGSRFTHCIGVMAVTRWAFDRLAQQHPVLRSHRAAPLVAALLHDLGHGPFSHTSEEIFGNHHEEWTLRTLQEAPSIRRLLDQFHPQLALEIEQIYAKQHPIPCIWQLVSSQLDCDRLDYLMRDSYFTGASYGQLDLERILMALNYDPATQELVLSQKGMTAVEHYLIVRYFMYAQVYNHSKNLAATLVLNHAFQRARELLAQAKLTADSTVQAWLQSAQHAMTLEQYLAADDIVFIYHLQQWCKHKDPVLSDLCQRFIHRNLLKAFDVTHHSEAKRRVILARARELSDAAGLLANYYVGLRITLNKGYTLYQRGIKVKTPQGLCEISDISPLVNTLTQPYQKAWLIYPREIEQDIKAMI